MARHNIQIKDSEILSTQAAINVFLFMFEPI
jgi:hypothetical protein